MTEQNEITTILQNYNKEVETTQPTRTKYVSDGSQFEARLVVYRDYTESNGYWRLFWEDVNHPGQGFQDESTVTGNPFFRTKREAVARGIRKHGITAIRAGF